MVNYKLAKIYKLENDEGKIYIGSTCEPTLARRLAGHKQLFKRFNEGTGWFLTSFNLAIDNNFDNVDIILIENCPCNSKDELHAREAYYIKSLDCVNKCVPLRPKHETDKLYREKNHDIIKENATKYRAEKGELIKQQMAIWREKNKDDIKAKHKIWRDKKKALKLINK